MPAMIQIRNVPNEMHRELKARAAQAGMSLSDYMLSGARKTLERPTMEELLARLKTRSPVVTEESPAEILRAERDRE
jgi:plasmid stability protein